MAFFRVVVVFGILLVAPVLGAATFTVNSTGDVGDATPDGVCDSDGGLCTLREAIDEANALAGPDTIAFNVTGTITYAAGLTDLVISDVVTIDGSTDPDFTSTPVVTLSGFMLSLVPPAGGSTIQYLEITGSPENGIYISSPGNTILGNWIGATRLGVSANFQHGIEVDVGAGAGNRIEDNVIGGNNSSGVQNGNDEGLLIVGNLIGLAADGTTAAPNSFNGINVFGDNVTIGGATAAERNVIATNSSVQVHVGPGVGSTQILGNYVGTNAAGAAAPFSLVAQHGIEQRGNNTLISGNVISANYRHGIWLPESGSLGTRIEGNIIGFDPAGSTVLLNGDRSIFVEEEDDVVIGGSDVSDRNVIAGEQYHVYVGSGALRTLILNNYIGTNATGNTSVSAFFESVVIFGSLTRLGAAGDGNVIGGGANTGAVVVVGDGNLIEANRIGIGADGTTNIAGTGNGIYVTTGVNGTAIGGIGAGNIIANSTSDGIYIDTALLTTITANWIGLAPDGITAAGNGNDGIENHGTTTTITGNVIADSGAHGINLPDSIGTTIVGNTIGLNATATAVLPNFLDGIEAGESGVVIGGGGVNRNIISGNVRSGIDVLGTASNAIIRGNLIGTNAAGAAGLGNGEYGIHVLGANALIGGTVAGMGNVVASSASHGIFINGGNAATLQGNLVGLDPAGTAALPNVIGVAVQIGDGVTIGGSVAGARNVISGNTSNGITLFSTTNAVISGNYIGTNAAGSGAIANGGSGVLLNGATTITIGGTTAGAGNVISGNSFWGIDDALSTALVIAGNVIGMNATGTARVPNSNGGIVINSDGAVIGGPAVAARNYISGNGLLFPSGQNVLVEGTADGTLIQNNFVGLGIDGDTAIVNSGDGIRSVGTNTNILNNVVSGNGNGRGINIAGLTGAGTIIRGNIVGLNAAGTAARENYYGVSVTPGNVAIGGLAAGEGNVISGNNQAGLELSGDNSVLGNIVGLNAAGTAGIPNLTGLVISGSNNVIGSAGGENHIGHNTNHGIAVIGGIRNRITRNSIHDNGLLGIDLFPPGVTPNDTQDPDEGPNHLQNYPVPNTAYLQGGTATISGTLNSTPITTFSLEFFSDTNPIATAEGRTYLGAWTVTTDPLGNAPFVFSPVSAPPAGASLTATATPPDDSTSEFSAAIVLLAPGVFDLSSATYSGNEAAGPITITVNRSGGSDGTVTVDYTTTDGSATAGADYTTTAGTLTFGPGVTSQQFAVPISNDGTFEGDETFTVTISNPTNGALLGTTTTAPVTITDDESTPTLSIDDATGSETSLFVGFVATLSHPSTQPVTFQYATAGITATGGSDYLSAFGPLTIVPGSTSLPISIGVLDDALAEPSETFSVTLSLPTNATILDGTAIGTILDNEGPVTASIDDETAPENAGPAIFTVTLSGPSGSTIDIDYTTTGITATAGSDYSTATGTISFAPGVTIQEIFVPILDDSSFEADETFRLNITSASVSIPDGEAIGTITSNDAAGADLALAVSAPGSAAPGSTVTITVTVTNQGPDTASGVTLNDVVPAGATGIGATTTQGTCTPGATDVSCTLGSITNGGSVTVTITFTAPAAGGTNTATVSAAELDPDSSDNQVVTVIAAAPGDEASIPTLTEWMLLLLGLSMAIVALRRL